MSTESPGQPSSETGSVLTATGVRRSRQVRATRTRVAALFLRDIVTRPRPVSLAEVPPSVDAITPEWLTEALLSNGPGRVTEVRAEHLSSGTSVRSLLHVTYSADADSSLPPTVFAKSTPTLRTRLQVGVTGGAKGEIRFYEEIQPIVQVLSPRGYHGAADRRTGRSVILLEDISRSRGAVFGDVRSLHIDRTRAESLVSTLAHLHGSADARARMSTDLSWLRSVYDVQTRLNAFVDYEHRTQVGLGRSRDLVPAALVKAGPRLHSLLMTSLERDAHRPLGPVHSDVHAGNWFVSGDEKMGLYDWSAIGRGQGCRDLAYAIASALKTEDRREWERELVDMYTAIVSEVSGVVHDPREMWDEYRRQTLHGLCLWLYTIGRGITQPSMQPRDISEINVARLAHATVDLDTIALLT
ncbi:phosphotransferase [Rhodococcus koreensis]|uniref:phosphotransferase n=1 Tax=Rhodococcus koreensis TaxID=99653 RepID=UPI00367295F9